jgi:flagellar basal-body rod protein FlgC
MSSISSSMHIGASAMNTFAVGMAVTAHNIANVNTAEFEPQRAAYATGPGGIGVQLETIFQGNGIARPEGIDTAFPTQAIAKAASYDLPPEMLNPSGTDLAREMVNMIVTQRSYEANTKIVRTGDEMLGTLLDIKT